MTVETDATEAEGPDAGRTEPDAAPDGAAVASAGAPDGPATEAAAHAPDGDAAAGADTSGDTPTNGDTSGDAAPEGPGTAAPGDAAGAEEPGRPWYRRPWVIPTAIVALAILLPARGVFRAPGPPMEEGFMLVFPERLLEGDIPNKDFLHLYGPGSIWVIAALFKVFGISIWTARVFGFLQLVGLIAGTSYVGYRWGRWPAAVAGTVTAIIIIPPIGVTALAWVGGVALALWAVILAARALDADTIARRRAVVAAGVVAGGALLFRPDLVVALGLSLGALFLWAYDGDRRRQLVLGLVAGCSPYVVHLVLAGPGNAVRGMVLEPVFDLRPGRRLPFPPPHDHFTSFLNRAYSLREFPWPLPAADQPMQIAVWFWILLAVCVALVVMGVQAKRAGSPQGWRLVALSLLAVGLLPQAIQRSDTAHLSWVSCVPFGLLPAFVAETAKRRGARPAVGRVAVLAPLALMLIFPHFTYRWYADYVVQSTGRDRPVWGIEHRGRFFYYGRQDVAEAAERLLDDVETVSEPGDRLIVGTGDLRKTPYSEAYLYFLLPQLDPGTRYIEMDPGMANAEDSGLADEMRRSDVIILSTVYDDWDEPNASRDFGSDEPNQVLAEEFCLHDSYGSNGGDRPIYALYVRCDASGATSPEASQQATGALASVPRPTNVRGHA
ncbi:MAG TPA: hypothetical protein VIL48_13850 [Acidimicrobiales bacterium]